MHSMFFGCPSPPARSVPFMPATLPIMRNLCLSRGCAQTAPASLPTQSAPRFLASSQPKCTLLSAHILLFVFTCLIFGPPRSLSISGSPFTVTQMARRTTSVA